MIVRGRGRWGEEMRTSSPYPWLSSALPLLGAQAQCWSLCRQLGISEGLSRAAWWEVRQDCVFSPTGSTPRAPTRMSS